MTAPVIIDAIVVVLLAGFCLLGAKRGLFRSLTGLLTVVVALVGAGILAATLTGPVTGVVTPVIRHAIEVKVDDALTDRTETVETPEESLPIGELLELLGLDEDVRSSLAERAEETVRDTGVSVLSAVAESLARSVIYGVLYILSFIALTILLHVLLKAMDLVLKLPGLHGLNTLGGGLIGLIEGVLLLFLAVWVLRRLGVSFETEALAEAHILRIFTTNTPLSVLSFLQ